MCQLCGSQCHYVNLVTVGMIFQPIGLYFPKINTILSLNILSSEKYDIFCPDLPSWWSFDERNIEDHTRSRKYMEQLRVTQLCNCSKVINPKYSKHRLCALSATIDPTLRLKEYSLRPKLEISSLYITMYRNTNHVHDIFYSIRLWKYKKLPS